MKSIFKAFRLTSSHSLARAFREIQREDTLAESSRNEEHRFSPEFYQKLDQLLEESNPSTNLKKSPAWEKTNHASDLSNHSDPFDPPDPQNYFNHQKKGTGTTMKHTTKRIFVLCTVVAALLLSALCAYAMIPGLRENINLLFLKKDSVGPLTEVPDGYTGVYTVEDLDAVRDDLDGFYILMNDIEIKNSDYEAGGALENGFDPIGTKDTPFSGIFNGNGHVISNLRIDSNSYAGFSYSEACGLFGYVKQRIYRPDNNALTVAQDGSVHVDQHASGTDSDEVTMVSRGGIIKNLGIEDSSITAEITKQNSYVGAIAGYSDYVAGCYTKNVTITVVDQYKLVEKSYPTHSVAVGGVAGRTVITDSCWSDADIAYTSEFDHSEEDIYLAGVTGLTQTIVTSYFNGTIQTSDGYRDYGVAYCDPVTPPAVLNDSVMRAIIIRSLDMNGEKYDPKLSTLELQHFVGESYQKRYKNDPNYNTLLPKFCAFYCGADFNSSDSYITYANDKNSADPSVKELYYVLDPETKPREEAALADIIQTLFPDSTFQQFCQENGLKYGYFDCYDLRETPDAAFASFDKDHIWYFENGLPIQRIFVSHQNQVKNHAEELRQIVRPLEK